LTRLTTIGANSFPGAEAMTIPKTKNAKAA